jgi:membrane associated rhomboid family serine protease
MFPVGDDDTAVRSVPVVTYGLVAANILFFLIELSGGDSFIQDWAFIPSRFSHDPTGNAPTIFTAMFMHGGWMHLFGNMLYLYIFGDNVEDRLGHLGYFIFYVACGIAATFAQYYFNSHSSLPNVGASGAIAGVLSLPAIAVIGFWIVLQLFSGFGSIARTDETADAGGIAYMAHVGGFVAGLVLALLFGGRGGPSRTA